MKKISFIIPNYNTKNYTEWCYNSIRKNLSNEHEIIFINDGCTDGTNDYVKSLSDNNYKYHINEDNIGIAYSYNKAVEIATNEIVCLLHSDMYIPKDFDKYMLLALEDYDFVTSYRIEPPVYPPSEDKLLKDFGLYLDEFKEDEFNLFIKTLEDNNTQLQRTCFPWMTTKTLFNKLGGIDELFLKYMVDDDDFYFRLAKAGYKYIQTFKTAVYHLCSRSTKYENDIIKQEGTVKWNKQYIKSTRNFIRKWGFRQCFVYNSNMSINTNKNKHNVSLVFDGNLKALIYELEPYFDKIYSTGNYDLYIESENKQTIYELKDKFKHSNLDWTYNDIIIKINNKDIIDNSTIVKTILMLRENIEKHLMNRNYFNFELIINKK